MCNVRCQDGYHVFVVGSWIQDIEYLRLHDVGQTHLYIVDEAAAEDYDDHGMGAETPIVITAIEPAVEGKIPDSQLENGYVYPYLITVRPLPKEVPV